MMMRDKFLKRVESSNSTLVTARNDSALRETDLIRDADPAEDLPTMRDVLWDIGVAVAAFAVLAIAANVFVLVTQGV